MKVYCEDCRHLDMANSASPSAYRCRHPNNKKMIEDSRYAWLRKPFRETVDMKRPWELNKKNNCENWDARPDRARAYLESKSRNLSGGEL